MKKQVLFCILFAMFFVVFSCKKDAPKSEVSSISKTENNVIKPIKIDTLSLDENEFGIGCTTDYYRKGSNMSELLYTQTPAKTEFGWVNYINIDGVKEVFKSENEDAISDADETGYSLKLENDSYIIEISAKIGETNIESDSTMATGILKITRKSDKATSTIEFEGGTAC